MKPPKYRSKPISKVIGVIYYGGFHLENIKKKTHKVHMNEGQSRDI
jgi:hypothetical protein